MATLEAEIILKKTSDVYRLITVLEEEGYVVLQDVDKERLLVVKNGNTKHIGTEQKNERKTATERADKEYEKLVKSGRPEVEQVDE
jgi:predicted regulator of Ras-like GTPase activity (Roadblock/LC7/MglB family)